MIDIKGVTKSFGDLQVLKGIDLHIERGQIFGLIGRSGTGKSTLLRCINGLETYDKGSLIVDNIDVKSLSEGELRVFRKDIGMIFQQFSLLNRLSVYENIALPLRCWKYSNSHIDKKVKELLEIIGIPDKINARPKELSGGQKQRVAIARALAMNPKLLLCDEATSALDPNTAKSIISLLNQINKDLGITIVIVTHQMSVLRSACEEIAIIEDGKVEAKGSVEKIFLEQPPALKNLIGQKDLVLPETGTNIEIFFSKENASNPIITKMARALDIDCIILGGEMDSYKNSPLGSIVINIPMGEYDRVKKYLISNRVVWKHFETND
jgi:D-methionine transport system ATP-binding protein